MSSESCDDVNRSHCQAVSVLLWIPTCRHWIIICSVTPSRGTSVSVMSITSALITWNIYLDYQTIVLSLTLVWYERTAARRRVEGLSTWVIIFPSLISSRRKCFLKSRDESTSSLLDLYRTCIFVKYFI